MSEPLAPSSSTYDSDTGLTTVEAADRALLRQVEAEAEEAQKYLDMSKTAGWESLSSWIHSQIDGCKERLVDTEDMQTIIRWQQTARAYSNLLGFVAQQVSLSKFQTGPVTPDNQ